VSWENWTLALAMPIEITATNNTNDKYAMQRVFNGPSVMKVGK